MKRFISILFAAIAALALPAALAAADNAARTLDLAAQRFSKAPSVSAAYTVTSPSGNVAGNIVVSGQRFRISSPEMSTWFDGKTQWTYVPADREVTVSEPTPDELLQINPFEIISSFRKNYNASTVKSDKSQTVIRLSSRDPKASITQAVLTLTSATLLPSRIELTGPSGRVTINLGSVKTGKAMTAADFRFNTRNHPGVSVNDMR